MREEIWLVSESDPVIWPEDILAMKEDVGLVCMQAVINQSVSITLHCDCMYNGISVSKEAAKRILEDGGVTVYSNGWWTSFSQTDRVKVCWLGTDEPIPMHDNYSLLNNVADALTSGGEI